MDAREDEKAQTLLRQISVQSNRLDSAQVNQSVADYRPTCICTNLRSSNFSYFNAAYKMEIRVGRPAAVVVSVDLMGTLPSADGFTDGALSR